MKPARVWADHGSNHWRGGQIIAINSPNATVKLHLEAHVIGTRTVELSLLPATVTAGDAIICRVQGAGAADYTIVETLPGQHVDPVSDQQASLARGEFHHTV